MHFIDNPLVIDEEGNFLGETPIIFECTNLGESVPSGFNAVSISLNGRINADLNWQKEKEAAIAYISQGLKIFWQMDLGLFSELRKPLSDSIQHLSLGIALKHFRESILNEFQSQTLGLSLYKGSIDFTTHFVWDSLQTASLQGWLQDRFHTVEILSKELNVTIASFSQIDPRWLNSDLLKLFCRDAAMEYITLLTGRLPGNLIPTVLLHTHSIKNPILLAQLLAKESYPRTHRAVTNDPWKIEFHGILSKEISSICPTYAKVGLCLSSFCYPSTNILLQNAWNDFEKKGIAIRPIAEATLSADWAGLDSIIVLSEILSVDGIRKLRGFCASGGTVITIGKPLQLPQEILYGDIK